VGHDRLLKRNPEALPDAYLFGTGLYYLGGRSLVSETEKEYWRRKRCSKGGKSEKQKRKKMREAVEAWRAYACMVERAGAETTITALAESLLHDRKKPEGTPSNMRTLEKFLGGVRVDRRAA
jgi:hypothetical protein